MVGGGGGGGLSPCTCTCLRCVTLLPSPILSLSLSILPPPSLLLLHFVSSSSSSLLLFFSSIFLSFRGIVGAEQLYHAARTIRGIGHALFSTHSQNVYGLDSVNLRCKWMQTFLKKKKFFFFKVFFSVFALPLCSFLPPVLLPRRPSS